MSTRKESFFLVYCSKEKCVLLIQFSSQCTTRFKERYRYWINRPIKNFPTHQFYHCKAKTESRDLYQGFTQVFFIIFARIHCSTSLWFVGWTAILLGLPCFTAVSTSICKTISFKILISKFQWKYSQSNKIHVRTPKINAL